MVQVSYQSRLLIITVLVMCGILAVGQPFAFRKINLETKADIQSIFVDNQDEIYLLTDKIFKLSGNAMQQLDLSVQGKISEFFPVTSTNMWFSVDQVTNTSMLYHYHDGITENIRSPFANTITCINFISNRTALLASFADVAAFENGTFRALPPCPTRNVIEKLYGKGLSTFWVLTGAGELFLYERGIYRKIPGHDKVTDFCFSDMQNGYLLAGDELFRMSGSGVRLICKNSGLKHINKLFLMDNGTVMMAGDKGLILSYANGLLSRHSVESSENLADLAATGSGDIWICGENGRLLYSGKRAFAEYVEDNQGFSAHKLIYYGISVDDEYGVALSDFNGDNKTDIYTVRIYEQNRMYINNLESPNLLSHANGFTEEAVKRNANGVINPQNSTAQNELKLGISAVDIDNDGDQDIYLCYLNSFNKLLLNRGDGYFRNISQQKNRACENMHRSNAAAFADVDNDGDLDLFVTNEEGSNRLFENNGTGHFTDITASSGLSSSGGGMCASFADINNDGLSDLCVTFWYPSNKLYLNDSKKGQIHFRDVTKQTDLATAAPSKSNAVAFADVNNDGAIDLFIANRNAENKLYINDGLGRFTDKTTEYFAHENYMSNGAVFGDFDLDGYQDLYITNVGENVLYKNTDGTRFTDVTARFGAELSGYSTGCATGDVDNDGDPDLYVANYINGNSKLFLNITEKKTFVKLKLHGTRSNKDAIGAKVWLYKAIAGRQKGVLAGYREVNGGSGYCSVSAKEIIFGMQQGTTYYALIKFPSSPDTLRIDPIVAGKYLEIYETKGLSALYTESRNSIVMFFRDQETQPEIIKYSLIILMLLTYNLTLRQSIRNIAVYRWVATSVIFVVFVFINQLYLFQWLSVSFFIAPLVVLGLLAILHLFISGIVLKRMALKDKMDLREKLSRDLHDDLASTLGSISIYAETLKEMNEPAQRDFKKLSVKIASLTQSAMQSISDIIWMTSPRNDSLQSLISKSSNYMLEILTDSKILFHSVIGVPDEPVILPEKIRNDAFLILKEGVHNIVRHSGAQNVQFKASFKENSCTLCLKDDGLGISANKPVTKGSHGNGLLNMRRRAYESGIEFDIKSIEGTGTEIRMYFKIRP